MSRHFDMVAEFHRVFRLPSADEVDLQDLDTQDLRLALIEEEWIELRDALRDGDEIEVADALADILYVTYGAALVFGIPIDDVMSAVHHSNMSKLWNNTEVSHLQASGLEFGEVTRVGPNACIVYTKAGKVVKPPSWERPNLDLIVHPVWPDDGRFERQG